LLEVIVELRNMIIDDAGRMPVVVKSIVRRIGWLNPPITIEIVNGTGAKAIIDITARIVVLETVYKLFSGIIVVIKNGFMQLAQF
jgi:hypothetical protein